MLDQGTEYRLFPRSLLVGLLLRLHELDTHASNYMESIGKTRGEIESYLSRRWAGYNEALNSLYVQMRRSEGT
jgi:hypothetical protein